MFANDAQQKHLAIVLIAPGSPVFLYGLMFARLMS